jgi:hypothetical protein
MRNWSAVRGAVFVQLSEVASDDSNGSHRDHVSPRHRTHDTRRIHLGRKSNISSLPAVLRVPAIV